MNTTNTNTTKRRTRKAKPPEPKRVRIGGKSFVPWGKLPDTLFYPGGTPDGEYRRLKYSIVFYRPDGSPFAAIITNPREPYPFAVTVGRQGKRLRYMFGLDDMDRARLGLPDGYAASIDECKRVVEEIDASRRD